CGDDRWQLPPWPQYPDGLAPASYTGVRETSPSGPGPWRSRRSAGPCQVWCGQVTNGSGETMGKGEGAIRPVVRQQEPTQQAAKQQAAKQQVARQREVKQHVAKQQLAKRKTPKESLPKHLVTKQQTVYDSLREEILDGALPPGTRLMFAELAQRFDMSPIPVREALRQLERENLIEVHPHVKVVVKAIPLEEAVWASELRMELEPIAVREAMPFVQDRHLREL